ncbi:MAG: hypothetical protein EOP90_04120 [Lysobacteraceae bacterium]|nr:MAG: hypothetical protein EOP90_04120 [Xanthomonadaceae bacterium]
MNPPIVSFRPRARDRGSRQPWRACACVVFALCAAVANAATVTTIDDTSMAGQPSLAIGADGLPVVAYRTLQNKLRVAKCNNWDCSDVAIIELTGTYVTSAHFALAITPAGNPAIAFQDNAERRLDVVRCVTADCTGGGHDFFTIDPGPNDVGAYVDWAFGPDNRAAFAYRDFTAGTLMYARCVMPACSAVDIETLNGGGQITAGDFASLAFAGRNDPFVSSQWENLTGAQDLVGVNGFDCSIVPCADAEQTLYYQTNTPAGVGQDMAIGTDDLPVFSHLGVAEPVLRFGRCADPDCDGNVSSTVIDDGDFAIGFDDSTSIGVRSDGRPVIAYQRQSASVPTFTELYVAECGEPSCQAVERVRIERSGDGLHTGIDADLAIDDDGAVVIAYFDQSLLDIKLARCSRLTCAGPGDRLFADGFEGVP